MSATSEIKKIQMVADKDPKSKFYFTDGSTYEGEYIGVEATKTRQGTGKYECKTTGNVYTGTWNDDNFVIGTLAFSSGASYNGGFQQGKFHGNGTYTWKDCNTLTGVWKDNCVLGSAVLVSAEEPHRWIGHIEKGHRTVLVPDIS